jgi:hypothetical protein
MLLVLMGCPMKNWQLQQHCSYVGLVSVFVLPISMFSTHVLSFSCDRNPVHKASVAHETAAATEHGVSMLLHRVSNMWLCIEPMLLCGTDGRPCGYTAVGRVAV